MCWYDLGGQKVIIMHSSDYAVLIHTGGRRLSFVMGVAHGRVLDELRAVFKQIPAVTGLRSVVCAACLLQTSNIYLMFEGSIWLDKCLKQRVFV